MTSQATWQDVFGNDDRAQTLQRLEFLARIMDSAFIIPGTNRRVGVDAFLGLLPVIGDAVSAALSSYLIWEAKRLGVSKFVLARMIGNVAVDTAVGAIPFAGDLFDAAYKANTRNLRLLKEHLEKTGRHPIIDGQIVRKVY